MLTSQERKSLWAATLAAGTWFVGVVVLSLSGALRRLPPMIIGSMILLWIAIPTVAYFRSRGLQQIATRVGLRAFTVFQAWRIVPGIWFVWLVTEGQLPARFGLNAGWGDIAAGVAGLVVAAFWARPSGYWTAHAIGLADFVLAVGTGMATMRANQAGMHAMKDLPGALIPLFAVGLTASTHFVAFDLLTKQRQRAASSGRPQKAQVAA